MSTPPRALGSASFAGDASTGRRAAHNLRKTSLCKLFLQNRCNQGNRCNYAHSQDELRCTQQFHKTKLCDFFQKGYCRLGASCRHAHGADELRQADGQQPAERTPVKEASKTNLNLSVELSKQEPAAAQPAFLGNPQFVLPCSNLTTPTKLTQPGFRRVPPGLSEDVEESALRRCVPPGLSEDVEEIAPRRRAPPGLSQDVEEIATRPPPGLMSPCGLTLPAGVRLPPGLVDESPEDEEPLPCLLGSLGQGAAFAEAMMQTSELLGLGEVSSSKFAQKKGPLCMSSFLDSTNKMLDTHYESSPARIWACV